LVGDIVGSPGRACFKRVARQLLESGEVHAIIANAENAAAGSGITLPVAKELFDAGATLMTLGDHTWGQRGFDAQIGCDKRIVRPANFPESVPGATTAIAETALGPIAVVSVLGQVFMTQCDNPFRAVDRVLATIPATIPVFVDVHAEATSEKIAMGYWLDGRVACVFGTHTHVQTADASVLPGGTGFITDVGMTGPMDSILGVKKEIVIEKFRKHMPVRFDIADNEIALCGCLFTYDTDTKRVTQAAPVRYEFAQ
jgi:metallophosphoesterase (TIGR00282 family)